MSRPRTLRWAMVLPHFPLWVVIEQTGNVVTERCARTHVRVTDATPVEPADIARAGFRAALVQAWPGLDCDPVYAEDLADMALDAILPELGR